MLQLDWNATINSLRHQLPQTQFLSWFQPVELIRCDETSVVLGVPSRFHEEWLRNNYSRHISAAIREQLGTDRQLEFEVLAQDIPAPVEHPASFRGHPLGSPTAIGGGVAGGRPALRLLDPNAAPDEFPDTAQPVPVEPPNVPPFHHAFFALGYNQIAYQCSRMFIDGLDPHINPLVIQGGVGMGKTHLLAEIGQRLFRRDERLRIRYTNAESFTGEMYRALKTNDMLGFKRKYGEETDVLLFDDVNGLSKRVKTQEALLHIFNEILGRGGRVAFSLSCSPHRLEDFIDPLKSRLLSGVLAELRFPTHEEKVELLSHIAIHNHMNVDGPVLRSIADRGQKDVREIIGSLLRAHLQSKLENKPLTCEYIVSETFTQAAPKEAITLGEIVSLVEHHFGVCRSEMMSKSRKGATVWARQVAMYLARTYTLLALEEIGKFFGRDHATVIHAFGKVTETMEGQPTRRYEVEFLKGKLQERAPKPQGALF